MPARILSLAIMFSACLIARAQDDADASALVKKAIAARGGDNLNKLKVVREKTRGQVFLEKDAIPFTGDSMTQFPGQFRLVFKVRINGQDYSQTRVLNGDKGWIVDLKGQLRELAGKELEEFRLDLFHDDLLRLAPLLRTDGLRLTLLGESKVLDKPALGSKVSAPGKRDLEMHFDKDSYLLVKMARAGYDADAKKLVAQEQFYGDYKVMDGVRYPTRLVSFQEGVKTMVLEVVEAQFPAALPADNFARPEAK